MDYFFVILIALAIGGSAGYGFGYYLYSAGMLVIVVSLPLGILVGGLVFDVVIHFIRPEKEPPFFSFLTHPIMLGLFGLLFSLVIIFLGYVMFQVGMQPLLDRPAVFVAIVIQAIAILFWISFARAQSTGKLPFWIKMFMSKPAQPTSPPPTDSTIRPAPSSSPPPGATIFGVKDDD